MNGGDRVISLDNVSFAYRNQDVLILRDITLNISEGEYISVIGENGSGKTTFLRLILGFLKPMKGSILLQSDRIAYVPQKSDTNHVGFPITVFEVLDSYCKLLKIKDREVIDEVLELVSMKDYKTFLIGNLSGGQIQKIMLARAFLGNPQILILDEPSTGIDADSRKEIYTLLKKINQEQKVTIIAVEHNLEAVYANSTQIYHLQNGLGHLCNPDKYAKEYLKVREENYNVTI